MLALQTQETFLSTLGELKEFLDYSHVDTDYFVLFLIMHPHVSVYVPHVCVVLKAQKRASNPPQLELQPV